MSHTRVKLCVGLCITASLTGCFRTSPPDQFFMISAVETAPITSISNKKEPIIGLGPIRVPDYLDRPQIVTALSEQEYKLSEDHRWAERLEVNLARVSLENLSHLIPNSQVVLYPWPKVPTPDIEISGYIHTLHVDATGQVRMHASWNLRYGKQTTVHHRFTCSLPTSHTDYSKIVAVESECIGRWNRDMAEAVRNVTPDTE